MLDALSGLPDGTGAQAAIDALMKSVTGFVAGGPASDDIAIVAFRMLPPRATEEASWDVESTPHEIMKAVESVDGFLERAGAAREDVDAVKLALEETMTNVATHSYAEWGGHIRVSAVIDPEAITVEVRDDGPEFDPTREAPAGLPSGGVEERPLGGLGLHLVRSMMSEIAWAREDGNVNRLRMTRRRLATGGTAAT
jgi:anti-sigma regulatory factor (Ser/Thr protein kinase)